MFFFFSSRRRHTRLQGDWSSDVCSSDLLRGRSLKSFSVRKEAKDHGGGGRIAGALDPGDRVALTEDAVTRGTSLVEAARAVRDAGAEPVLMVAVVDRGGTCAAMAEAEGIAFRALVTAPDLGF